MTHDLSNPRVLITTILAMLAFAANSVLCRLALGSGSIDAASFTLLRLASGAVVLWLLVYWRTRRVRVGNDRRASADTGNWISSAMLFLYAICFSIAYLMLNTGTGALILFGFVQLTMVIWALSQGERPTLPQWLGWALALAGLTYLVMPGVTAPAPAGAILMATAGIAWGVYSLRGRGAGDPVQVTADNFFKAVPMALGAALIAVPWFHVTGSGLIWAVASGAIASGLGYSLWYQVLPVVTATQAATCQLSVPLIAALAGVLLLSEPLTLRLTLAGAVILGGIGLSIYIRPQKSK